MTPRLATSTPKTASALAEALSSVDSIRDMLLKGEPVKDSADLPVLHTTYAVGVPPDMGEAHPANGKECLIIAIPLDQSFGDLRIKPRRYDEAQGKYLAPSINMTVSATCGQDAAVEFIYTHVSGQRIALPCKKGLTVNIGLVGTPRTVEAEPLRVAIAK